VRVYHKLCGVRSPVGLNFNIMFYNMIFVIQIIITYELIHISWCLETGSVLLYYFSHTCHVPNYYIIQIKLYIIHMRECQIILIYDCQYYYKCYLLYVKYKNLMITLNFTLIISIFSAYVTLSPLLYKSLALICPWVFKTYEFHRLGLRAYTWCGS